MDTTTDTIAKLESSVPIPSCDNVGFGASDSRLSRQRNGKCPADFEVNGAFFGGAITLSRNLAIGECP
jgi:hypothetical protein